jgi:hypothetical protein
MTNRFKEASCPHQIQMAAIHRQAEQDTDLGWRTEEYLKAGKLTGSKPSHHGGGIGPYTNSQTAV